MAFLQQKIQKNQLPVIRYKKIKKQHCLYHFLLTE